MFYDSSDTDRLCGDRQKANDTGVKHVLLAIKELKSDSYSTCLSSMRGCTLSGTCR